jgi:hypothetical protein
MLHEVKAALQNAMQTNSAFRGLQRVVVVMPEISEEFGFCDWDGSGQFNMSRYAKPGLPTLAQIVSYIQMMDDACDDSSRFIIHLTSKNSRRTGALLIGSLKVISHGMSADEAWGDIQLGSPAPSQDPALAWDRFSGPFSVTRRTSATSLQVKDCLLGLQFARDLGWVAVNSKSGSFDAYEWDYLRRKFDLTWIIPGEIAAMGHPSTTARNPVYPGLLEPLESCKEHGSDEERCRADSLLSTAYSEGSTPRSRSPSLKSPCSTIICIDEWDFDEDDIATEANINSFPPREVDFCLLGLEDGDDDSYHSEDRDYQVMRSWSTSANFDDKSDAIPTGLSTPNFASYFQRASISKICRLNFVHECIEQDSHFKVFRDMGMSLHQCAFEDGGIPSRSNVQSFLEMCRDVRKRDNQRIAVHCMAG